MNNAPAVVRSKKLETQLKSEVISRNEFEIVYQDKSNYWDQVRALLNEQGWTTHDHATLNLVSEIPNSHAFFAVRKTDNLVLGAINFIDTPNFVYGNFYVIRKEYRAAGVGSELVRKILRHLAFELHTKGFVSRAESMKTVLKNEKLMTAVQEYDTFVTRQDRAVFLKNYYSIDFVEGLVIFDNEGKVKGMAGIVPTGIVEGHYKMNPIYASCNEDAVLLMHLIAQKAKYPHPVFLLHVRTKTAGNWILKKCKEDGRSLISRGCTITLPAYPLYKDRASTEYMYAPTNSPAHFDG